MTDQQRCGLCGRADHDVRIRPVEWTDAVRSRVEGLPRWESIYRCPDFQACRSRVEHAGGTWPVRDVVTRPTVRQPEAREEVPVCGHKAGQGEACIMEVVAMLAGERFSDHPACTDPAIAAFCRTFWDRTPRSWQGLLDRVDRIAGSASTKDVTKARGYLAADWAVRRFAPRWLRRLDLEDDAVRLEQLPPVTDAKSARKAEAEAKGIRQLVNKRYYDAIERLRRAAEAAWAAGAAEAAGAAGAAEAAEAAGAAWAAEADWPKVKAMSYSQQKAYFRDLIRPHIEKALASEIDASIADGFALLDAMLELGTSKAAAA